MTEINYGFDRLEHITVLITEQEYKEAIAQLALAKVQAEGKISPDKWGHSVELMEKMKGDFTVIERWAQVEFHRRVEEKPE